MTPRKIFFFGLCVFAVIVSISLIVPGGWKIGNLSLRYPDYRIRLKPDTVQYKDIRAIIASVDTADHHLPPPLLSDNDTVAKVDSTILPTDSLRQTPARDVHADAHPFEFPQGQDTLLFPLFRSIDHMHRRNRPLRILHYGDSQIEGDRITATIRNYMQKNYGGQGIGFLPIIPANEYSVTFQQDISPNWQRISVLNSETATFSRFGIAGSLTRYHPSDDADTIAHIGFQPFYIGYRNVRSFTHARLFYGAAQRPFSIVVNRTDTQQMIARNTLSSAWWRFEAPQNSLDLSLMSSHLPDLYGITLDGARGVAVDNLPLRGSSGLDVARMDTVLMGQMFRMMDVEMLIVQFGANIVPHVVDNYDYYARRFVRELHLLKALKRGITVVVISVNDISQNTPHGYRSYPNVTKIRDAQKKAAFEVGCVFWDLYEAMGGENSMPGWALAKPPLAQKDFVHFTIGGAKIVAELFCRAWEMEYQKYRATRSRTTGLQSQLPKEQGLRKQALSQR